MFLNNTCLYVFLENSCRNQNTWNKFASHNTDLYRLLFLQYQVTHTMLAFLKRKIKEKQKSYQSEATEAESTKGMTISKKYLEVLRSSFEISNFRGVDNLSKKKKKVIKALENKMQKLHNDTDSKNTKFDDIIALAVAYYNVGQLYTEFTENNKLHTAINTFLTCLRLLGGKELDRKAILTSVGALNELSLVTHKLQNVENAFLHLNAALELYIKYTKDNYLEPINIATIVGIEQKVSDSRIILDNLHITTLHDIGTHYYIHPKDKHEFVTYLHNILKKELSTVLIKGKQITQFECLDWALTLVDISRYFVINNRFIEGRNHLATADYIMFRFSEDVLKYINKENCSEYHNVRISYNYVRAYITKFWGSYGTSLLRYWIERFQKEDKSCKVDESKSKQESEEELTHLIYCEKELQLFNRITELCILNFTDAKSVFIKSLRCLDGAKRYFCPESDIQSYVLISLDISRAYKYLASFEQERKKQIKLHKRRIENLEDISEKLHLATDENGNLNMQRQVWFELTTSCSTVMDLLAEDTYGIVPSEDIKKEFERYAQISRTSIDLYVNTR
ncbi:KIF1-binding protein homolog isoform X2 [Pogonomyrmex barbatus]|uniref:KIF-binding protein n=1 Tax=Pogonomyrmex barbatus TaxID=144034 RepID=A0A6I9W447_9HYME|nr:KIF1-binding protein homolog isoform X2 [Pogonomyrmex barbatus]